MSLYRPTEVQTLLADPSKAVKAELDPSKTNFDQLVEKWNNADLDLVAQQKNLIDNGSYLQINEFPHFKE